MFNTLYIHIYQPVQSIHCDKKKLLVKNQRGAELVKHDDGGTDTEVVQYACMCVCMYVYMYVCMYVHACTYVYT